MLRQGERVAGSAAQVGVKSYSVGGGKDYERLVGTFGTEVSTAVEEGRQSEPRYSSRVVRNVGHTPHGDRVHVPWDCRKIFRRHLV